MCKESYTRPPLQPGSAHTLIAFVIVGRAKRHDHKARGTIPGEHRLAPGLAYRVSRNIMGRMAFNHRSHQNTGVEDRAGLVH